MKNLVAADDVSICQMIGHTLWKNCRMSINGTQVFEGNDLMAYKSVMDYELTYPESVKRSYLNVAGYYTDAEDSQLSGAGYTARRTLFAKSKTAQFIARLDVDPCNQPRYIVNQCEVDIELLPHSSQFVILAPNAPTTPADDVRQYHLEVISCKLYVKKAEVMDSLALDISKKLELRPARYPLRKTSMKALFISENRTEFTANLWSDQVPKRIVIGLVSNASYVGSAATSPFDFRPFDVRDISICASGRTHPQAQYSLDFPNGRFARIYHDTQEAVGYAGTLDSNGISMKRYAQGGQCFFVFNLAPSAENAADTFDLIRKGTTAIRISFNAPVPARGIVLIGMAEIDALLMLDKNRTVASDIHV
uniref:Uncharacterized protein n=1 Tax=Globodera pallida TaxID=36090 RepID=A0A183C8K8_GLOPA